MVLVDSEDEYHINPAMFDNNWNHQDKNKHQEWHDTIQKEIGDMAKREVWCKAKNNQILNNRFLIGSKWVFKKKRNSV